MEMKTYLRALETIETSGIKAWLVGDPVRDIAMGVYPSNLTVVVGACDLKALAASLGQGAITGVESFPTLHVSIRDTKVEISCMRGNSIEEELSKRDFSMNAMAIRSDGAFVDPFNGRHDVRNSLIRLTGDDIDLIRNDPIRIVRMLRFAAELDMYIFWKCETDVRVFIANNPDKIKNTPPERWGREIVNGISLRPYDFIYLCDRYQILPFFLNELERLKEIKIDVAVAQKTLFDHIMDTLQIVQIFLSSRKRRENDMAFSLAMLFHHAGAVSNQPLDEATTAEIAISHLKAWNVSSDTIETVNTILSKYRSLYQPMNEEQLAAEVMEFGLAVVEMTIDFAICNARADDLKNVELLVTNKWKLGEVERRFEEAKRKSDGNIRYMTGDEVMKILDIKPGKIVGEILNQLGIAVGAGMVGNKKEAIEWLIKRGTNA
jgi:tRNA nucleotidyltransferase/poly(A) polymerase